MKSTQISTVVGIYWYFTCRTFPDYRLAAFYKSAKTTVYSVVHDHKVVRDKECFEFIPDIRKFDKSINEDEFYELLGLSRIEINKIYSL